MIPALYDCKARLRAFLQQFFIEPDRPSYGHAAVGITVGDQNRWDGFGLRNVVGNSDFRGNPSDSIAPYQMTAA